MALMNKHDIRALDRFLLINLSVKKIKLINLQELSIIRKLQNQGYSLLTSGIIELAFPGLALHYNTIARAKIHSVLNAATPALSFQTCADLCDQLNISPEKLVPKWLNVGNDCTPVNPFATSIYWLQLIHKGFVESLTLKRSELAEDQGALLSCVEMSFLPSLTACKIPPSHKTTLLYNQMWNDLPFSLSLVNKAVDHSDFCALQTGFHDITLTPHYLTEWLNAPPCFGSIKSVWLEMLPATIHDDPIIQKNLELLTTIKNDNIVKTRTAIYDVAVALSREGAGLSNPIWERIMHLSPTF